MQNNETQCLTVSDSDNRHASSTIQLRGLESDDSIKEIRNITGSIKPTNKMNMIRLQV